LKEDLFVSNIVDAHAEFFSGKMKLILINDTIYEAL